MLTSGISTIIGAFMMVAPTPTVEGQKNSIPLGQYNSLEECHASAKWVGLHYTSMTQAWVWCSAIYKDLPQ